MEKASISLDQAEPHFGDVVTFTYDAGDTHVGGLLGLEVRCFQGDELVYGSGGWPIKNFFQLGPTQKWSGGEATGKAVLLDINPRNTSRTKELASTTFDVLA